MKTSCWVINNETGEAYQIDEDPAKPVYLKDGLPCYNPGQLFKYHLANRPPEDEDPAPGEIGHQMTINEFLGG